MQNNTNQDIPKNKPIPAENGSPEIVFHSKFLEEKPLLSPFLANSLEYLRSEAIYYSQRHNMLMVASQRYLVFYNATTLEEIKKLELGRSDELLQDSDGKMAYSDETNTCIFGCNGGFFYSYNISNGELKKLQEFKGHMCQIEFVGPKFYAFYLAGVKKLEIASLENEDVVRYARPNIEPNGLHYLAKSTLLLASFNPLTGNISLRYQIEKLLFVLKRKK